MRILYYIPLLDQSYGGIRQYAANLLQTFGQIESPSIEVLVYHDLDDILFVDVIDRYENFTLIRNDDLNSSQYGVKNFLKKRLIHLFRLLLGKAPGRIKIKSPIEVYIIKNKIDLIYCPYQDLPIKLKGISTISTLHDIQEIHFPEFFDAETRLHRAKKSLDIVRNADRIVVSYNHIAEDLVKYFQVDKNKVVVMLLNMGNLWFEKLKPEVQDQKTKYANENPFLLYPANFWPHKNHKKLIEAFKVLCERTDVPIKLVLTGNADNPSGTAINELIKDFGLTDKVQIRGIVSENELFELYMSCSGVVVPTLYEAGSFPLMESILMRIPVIVSDVTSLPETIDNDLFVFSPNDVESIADSMLKLIEQPEFREASITNSKRVSSRLLETGCEKILGTMLKEL